MFFTKSQIKHLLLEAAKKDKAFYELARNLGPKVQESMSGKIPAHLSAQIKEIEESESDCHDIINCQDLNGSTALIVAAYKGDIVAVVALIAAGADVNKKNRFGVAPIHHAVRHNYQEIVEELISAGANLEGKCRFVYKGESDFVYNFTPLNIATYVKNPTLVMRLLAAGANPDSIDEITGYTALHFAAVDGDFAVVKSLLDSGADFSVACRRGVTALFSAVFYGHTDVAIEMINRIARITDDLGPFEVLEKSNLKDMPEPKKGGKIESFLRGVVESEHPGAQKVITILKELNPNVREAIDEMKQAKLPSSRVPGFRPNSPAGGAVNYGGEALARGDRDQ